MHQKLKQLKLHSNVPIILLIFCSAMQKICFAISLNTVHWNSGKSSKSTNWVVNVVIEFPRSIKLIQIHEIVLIIGSRTAASLTRSGTKFYFKSCIFQGSFRGQVKKCQFPLFLMFTDVNNVRFNLVNTDKSCWKKAKSSEKAFNS